MPQGLDRIITVRVQAEGMRNEHGEFVEGAVTPIRVWASRRDRDLTDIAEEGGTRGEARRDWRIRWRADLAGAATSSLAVQDDRLEWTVDKLVEVTGRKGELRRRWLDIQGRYTT